MGKSTEKCSAKWAELFASDEVQKAVLECRQSLKEARTDADARWLEKFGRPFIQDPDDFADLLAEHGESITAIVDPDSPLSNADISEVRRLLEVKMEAEQKRTLNAGRPQPAIPAEIPETPAVVEARQNGDPFLGLVFHHDSTVSRLGSDYRHIPPIALAPQPLKLLKFLHEAGKRGRTVRELVPGIVETKRILTSEKSRFDLCEIDIDLGGNGQYVVRCTKQKAL